MNSTFVVGGIVAWAMVTAEVNGDELEDPVAVRVGGRPIDVEHGGHAHPFVVDFDGDGRNDLLVGQVYHDEGRLRIYRNVGTNARPKFDGYHWFEAGAGLGRVPYG